MQKRISFVSVVMLIAQMFLNTFGAIAAAATTDADPLDEKVLTSEVVYFSESEKEIDVGNYEGEVTAQVTWAVPENGITAEYTEELQLSDKVIFTEMTGELEYASKTVGNYTVTEEGLLNVSFNEAIEMQSETPRRLHLKGRTKNVTVAKPASETVESQSTTEESAQEESATEESEDLEPASEKVAEATVAPTTNGPMGVVDGNLITDFEFTVNPGGPSEVVVTNNDDLVELDFSNLTALSLKYGLTKPNDTIVSPGDTYTISLPEIFVGYAAENRPIKVDGFTVATYDIVNGEIVITFTENTEIFDQGTLWVEVSGDFNVDLFEEDNDVKVEIPLRDEASFTVTITPKKTDYDGTDKKTAAKVYTRGANGEKNEPNGNPEFADWVITANDSMKEYSSAKVIDDLGDNLELIEESIVVHKIIRNYKNDIIGREEVAVTPTITATGFEIDLGDIEDAYEISYTTRLIRPEGGGSLKINNAARIELDNQGQNYNEEIDVSWSGDVPSIEKNGNVSSGNADIINWEVKYNFAKEDFGNVDLTDTLSLGEIDFATIKVFEVNTDIDGKIISGSQREVTVAPYKNEAGQMVIPSLDANGKAYYITFDSSVPLGTNDTIMNEIEDTIGNEDDASVTVNTIPDGGKIGEQLVDDDGNPYIKWTIDINKKLVDIQNINIKDVFNPEHLTFDASNTDHYELRSNGEIVSNFTIKPYEHTDGREGFELNITNAGANAYQFVYRTYYTTAGMQQPNIANHAEFVYDEGIVGVPVDYRQAGPQPGITKSGKYVHNETSGVQEIEWVITFNTANILLENPTIKDVFTSANYTYIDNSMTVLENGQAFTGYGFDKTADGFEVSINKHTNATYTITYRTTADDANNENQDNKAVLNWQGRSQDDTAQVGYRSPGSYKNGEVIINDDGSKSINWTVTFNTNQNVIYDFLLTDTTLPNTVTINKDSIKITSNSVDVTNQFTISDPANGVFTVKKDELAPQVYVLTYTSSLSPAEEANDVTNAAEIKYRGGQETARETVQKPTIGVAKEALEIDKIEAGDFISWKITANTDSANKYVNLVNAVLEDKIPKDQKLVPSTIKVVREDGTLIAEAQADSITEWGNSFSINLPNGPYQYTITFQTEILEYPSVSGAVGEYSNSTKLTNQPGVTGLESSDEADASINYFKDGTNNNSDKSGVINDDTENIDWTLTLNPLGLKINNTRIVDTLTGQQHYIRDSIKVFDMTNPNEPVEITVPTEKLDIRDRTEGSGEQFEIQLGTIDYPVQVTYSTRLDENVIGRRDLSNKAQLYGGDRDDAIDEKNTAISATQWYYGGGGTGRTVSFSLNKKHVDGQVNIANTEFEFIRITANGNRVTPLDNIVTTDANGTFNLSGIRSGRYEVTEKNVLDGYVKLTEPLHLIIGYSSPEEIAAGAAEYSIVVTDENWVPTSSNIAKVEVIESQVNLNIFNDVERENIIATKQWGGTQPGSLPIYFSLYRTVKGETGEPEFVKTEALWWGEKLTWYNMPKYAPEGATREYEYFVKEVDADGNDFTPQGYIKHEEGLTVVNRPIENPTISVTKRLEGRPLIANEFEFVLTDVTGENSIVTAKNDAQGNVVFSNFLKLNTTQLETLKANGTLTLSYTINEVANGRNGVTYDTTVYPVNVRLTYNSETESYDAEIVSLGGNIVFNNEYDADPTSVTLTASKQLQGLTLGASQFNFELVQDNQVIQTKQNAQDGTVSFDSIAFDSVGTYYYQIREQAGDLGGVTYDTKVFNVKIDVRDNPNTGELEATTTYLDGPATFQNVYTPAPDSAVVTATKLLNNRDLITGQFSFELRNEAGDLIDTAFNNAAGQITFDELTFTEVGTYKYTVNEVRGNQTGYTYDDKDFNLSVVVTDNGQGQLTATLNELDGPVVFENTYAPEPNSVVLHAEKVLKGLQLVENQFEFILKGANGQEIERKRNNNQGEVNFTEITYTAPGTYRYTIEEVDLGQNGITYDSTVKNVTVHVTDNQGTLESVVVYGSGSAVFTNSYVPAPDAVVIEAEKLLQGQQLRNGQFTFELVNETGVVLQTVNNAYGDVIFDELPFAEVGEFTFTIREKAGVQGGVTYDPTEFEITVTVTDDGSGELEATVAYPEEGVTFNNQYVPADGSAVIEAQKTFEGQNLTPGRFAFNLLDENAAVIQTVRNNAQGQVIFAAITYDAVGEYNYSIQEVNDNQGGVTYDNAIIPVTVTVTDDGEGQLVAAVTYEETATFTNTYATTPVNLSLDFNKQLIGQPLEAEQFTFTLWDGQDYYQTTTNAADGKVSFNLHYTTPGTFTYIISEEKGNQGGMTYDARTKIVVVRVTDNSEGKLVAIPTYFGNELAFQNLYTFEPAEATIQAEKILNGKDLVAGQFSFQLVDAGNNVIETVENEADGSIAFSALTFDVVGEYQYTIREVQDTVRGYTYDTKDVAVTITVTDNREGQYESAIAYAPEAVFTNNYQPLSTELVLEGTKELIGVGRELAANEFNFEVVDTDENVVATATNDADGKVVFTSIAYDYTAIGTHEYTIREEVGSDTNITYDETGFTITVTVTDVEGQLEATVETDGEVVFENIYTPHPTTVELEMNKELDGRDLVSGEFDFEVVEGNAVVATGTNDADGKVTFTEIEFTKAGTHEYIIREVVGDDSNITYDETTFTVTVAVVDVEGQLEATVTYPTDVTFENIYTPHPTDLALEVEKVLAGRTQVAGEFTFEVVDATDNVVATGMNAADGKVVFTNIAYTEVGTHEYTIREVIGTDDNITYDETTIEVTVTVVDVEGQLEATATYPTDVSFNNVYTPHPVEVSLEASKELAMRELAAEEFMFEVVDTDNNVIATATNNEDGTIDFPVTFTEVGTYEFIIREVAGTDSEIVYDETTFNVTVEVIDEAGQLVATVTYEEKVEFNNLFDPPRVSVGDYVWIDENKDGLQDDTDTPIEGVVLYIVDENGDPVKDVYGNDVEPTTTDEKGWYTFKDLPIDKTYTVHIDREASEEVLKDIIPTKQETGEDNSIDSSTWESTSEFMDEDGKHDPTLDFGFIRPSVSVGDYVWIDENKDGLQDKDEDPIPGVVLKIVDEKGNPVTDVFGKPVGPTTTDENGWYTFKDLPVDKTYTVRIDREASKEVLRPFVPTKEEAGDDRSKDSSTWEATSEEMTEDGQHDPTLDFGFNRASVSVGDYVWIDENKDGLQDATDTPIAGVVLKIVDENGKPVTDVYGKPVGPTTTDEKGWYTFKDLPIDKTYTVHIDREASKEALKDIIPTKQEVGEDNSADSSTWKATSEFMDKDGKHDPTLDFGFIRPSVSVGDYVWIDKNKDGLQDATDTPIPGVVLEIFDENGKPVTDVYGKPVGPTTTDKNGWYTFKGLPVGKTYTVKINREASKEALKGIVPTKEESGEDNSIDSSSWLATSVKMTEDGQHDPTLDFGFVLFEEEPIEPEQPEVPSEPGEPGVSEPSVETETSEETLPYAGAVSRFASTLAGMALLASGTSILYFKKRKKEEN